MAQPELDTNNTHTQTDPDTGQSIQLECVQKDTINRIFLLWKETSKQQESFQRQLISRDQKIKDAFDETQRSIQDLTMQLREREQINGQTQKEIDRLEGSDGEVYHKIDELSQAMNRLEGNNRILLFIVPLMFTIILAIQAIIFYSFLQHVAIP